MFTLFNTLITLFSNIFPLTVLEEKVLVGTIADEEEEEDMLNFVNIFLKKNNLEYVTDFHKFIS
jgi:hypothetical protein